jgi:hypothetical protein
MNFDRLEAHLRALFEKNLPKIFTGHQPDLTLVDELMQVMQSNTLSDDSGRLFAPDLFLLNVSPKDVTEWHMHRDILDEIANSIHTMGLSVDLVFNKPPKIELVQKSEIKMGSFVIAAHFSPKDSNLPDTAAMPLQEEEGHEPSLPENAMLIIGGKTSFPLEKPVIDIGRHSSNDLVLADPHVSRHHAQLRAIKNNYVIFDVGSTGGLLINNRLTHQATLHAGDVIRIGTVNLIYNQESTNAYSTTVLPVEDFNNNPGDDV